MSSFKRKIYGWVKSDPAIYRNCFRKYGGSVNAHPDVINFIANKIDGKIEYYHKEAHGEIVAAYALTDNKTIGVNHWRTYPLSYDEVVVPVAPGYSAFFPEKTNRLSNFNKSNFINANFSLGRKNKVCIAKVNYSSKTEKNRRNEYNKFLRAGGRCRNVSEFSAEELADLYIMLFNSRFEGSVKCYSRENLVETIQALKTMVFGVVLFVNDEPCAMDLIFMAEADSIIYFDVPNGGVNKKYSDLSPGSLLMWKNISAAREHSKICGKEMRFSIGSLDENWNYKLRWANAYATGKTLF